MASGFVPYGVGVGVYPSVAAAAISSVQPTAAASCGATIYHQYPVSDGGGGDKSTSYQNPNPSHDQYQEPLHHNQNNQAESCSFDDGNSIMGSGLSLSSSQPMPVAPGCSDPMGGVGPMSPLMWPLTSEEECAPSLWDYGDPFFLDFKGFDS
ncbi:ethylene-responsive transcription factor ABI4 [Prunus yedoensis var. nudiflora]|uniref:Ethylene-responsive transcription factor ABI4 n=1 Tax=Prunus yedoensis var. nudiflora TaxID=2094558 RepID=A0A314ZJK1_PRUYE|nr:ethylene-responsive transcription factor ABI4 [Prunus yedoensis var. nudiflora]